MADISQIAISGRVANEPTLKYTNSGTAVLSFSLACNRWNMGKTLTSFYDCTLWGKFAEAKDKILQKGMHVVASGTIDIVEFEGRNGKVRKPQITVSVLEPSPLPKGDSYDSYGVSQENDFTGGPETFEDDIPF